MYRTEIIVDKFDFGTKPNGNQNSNYKQKNQNIQNSASDNEIEYPTDDINPEDIPF